MSMGYNNHFVQVKEGAFMLQNKTRLAIVAVLLLGLVIIVLLSLRASQQNQPAPAPTVNINSIQTEAVSAFITELTSTAQALPTPTSTSTALSTPTTQGTDAVSPTPSCYRLLFLRDVTIPDNTVMTPVQVFTKTWLVENSGTCAWRPGFKLVLVGGDAMGGSPFTLVQNINPGDKIEISIKMVAPPNQSGIIQGTWQMSDENGTLFKGFLTVVIDIGGTSTGTPSTPVATTLGATTLTATTPAPTATP
jgi:uncharacterized protein affecting Mg2+/Co2+ transport